MARLPRLEVPGSPHLLLQRGHNGEVVVRDAADSAALHSALQQASRDLGVVVHAYGIWHEGFLLLATPERSGALGLMMQSVGRRYAAHFNRRHARSGGLWDGRFRATVVDPVLHGLDAQQLVESRTGALAVVDWRQGAPSVAGGARRGSVGLVASVVQASVVPASVLQASVLQATTGMPRSSVASGPISGMAESSGSSPPPWSSASHHLGLLRDSLVQDSAAYWALGNTPFERENAWRLLLDTGLSPLLARRLSDAVDKGWVLGRPEFVAEVGRITQRRTSPLPRGRPRRGPPQPTADDPAGHSADPSDHRNTSSVTPAASSAATLPSHPALSAAVAQPDTAPAPTPQPAGKT